MSDVESYLFPCCVKYLRYRRRGKLGMRSVDDPERARYGGPVGDYVQYVGPCMANVMVPNTGKNPGPQIYYPEFRSFRRGNFLR